MENNYKFNTIIAHVARVKNFRSIRLYNKLTPVDCSNIQPDASNC